MSQIVTNIQHQLNIDNYKDLCDDIILLANRKNIICDFETLYEVLYKIANKFNLITNLKSDFISEYKNYIENKLKNFKTVNFTDLFIHKFKYDSLEVNKI